MSPRFSQISSFLERLPSASFFHRYNKNSSTTNSKDIQSVSNNNNTLSSSSSYPTIYDVILPGTHDSAAYCTRPELVSRSTVLPLLNRRIRSICSSVQTDFALTQDLSVLDQLRAGARFLDLRVTKRPKSSDDDSFWTHHGMVLCTTLHDILQQINQFHNENSHSITIVLVFRSSLLDENEEEELVNYVSTNLKHPIYQGTAQQLRSIPISKLPHNVVAGLKDFHLDIPWGQDAWLDTYNSDNKIQFLKSFLHRTKHRIQRSNLFVLGWTVTPSVYDVVFRVVSIGMLRPSVKTEAVKMNERFAEFVKQYNDDIQEKVNVIFFDCFSSKLAQMVKHLDSSLSSDSDDSTNL